MVIAMNSNEQVQIQKLRELIDNSSYIVFLGGAGVSTESGIPDFRSEDGIYSGSYKYPPEVMLSHDFFIEHTAEFYDFLRATLGTSGFLPNAAHTGLAELERRGKLKAVITQNIDGLHQAAGSRQVLELHGNAARYYCMKCGLKYSGETVDAVPGVPRCSCGGLIRPDVVLYGEGLDQSILSAAVSHIRRADMLIVGGTSLNVYPAAGLVNYYSGDRLVLINGSPTPFDSAANLLISSKIGEIFSNL